ncbi:desmoglein-4-like [Lithobates pipiens]
MDWKLFTHINAFILLLICLQCSCNWNVQVNKGKDKYGNITWQEVQYSTRPKRTWVVPPLGMREEEDNRPRNPVAKVHSDLEVKKGVVFYRITGQGVDQPPYNVFIMDPRTGYLNVTDARIDREQTPFLYLTVHAVTASGQEVEKPLKMTVKIQDINDNPPIFGQTIFAGSVEERCQANTLVMQLSAYDADEQNTVNSQIAYKILSQSPSDPPMFIINQYTGEVFTISNFLDRETYSTYSLYVSASDLNGAAGGLSGQCGADITIQDVNDNFPVLEFDSYSVSFVENMIGLTDLRMKVFDADEMYTDNWIAVFEIVSGNEGGWFVIDTDAQTNEGILRIVKALDYESMQMANLAILVTNRAAFHYSVMSEYQAKMTSINVQVQNEIEGPVFVPNNIYLTIPQGLSQEELLQYVLGKVTAMNPETGQAATNVVYSLDSTSSRWFIIDSTTGEIKMTLEMARGNGPNAPNGTYSAIVFATEDGEPARTGTANVTVSTVNENLIAPGVCPTITTEPRVVCRGSGKAIIKATQNPSNAPFTITLSPSPGWSTEFLNDTAIYVVPGSTVGPGNYTVRVSVSDKNNLSCPNPVDITITVCECTSSGSCDASKLVGKSVSLGPAAIGLMVLGFLLLLLALLLLLLCLCGAGAAAAGTQFVPVAAGYEGACHQWGTEGAKPEDVDMTSMLITSPCAGSEIQQGNYGDRLKEEAMAVRSASGGMGGISGIGGVSGIGVGGISGAGRGTSTTGFETFGGDGGGRYTMEREFNGSLVGTLPPSYREGGTLNMAYVENYFADKAEAFANEDEGRPSNDCLLIYDNEGVGSPAGSVGCCSFIADDFDEDFLDTLGPKFKTLAEICIGSEIDIPGVNHSRPFPSVPIVETDTNVIVNEPSLNIPSNRSVSANSSAFVTESSFPSTSFKPAMPTQGIPGNVVVTETYTTTENPMRPVVRTVEPSMPGSILVTERVVGSTSTPHGVFTNVPNSSNVIVTERVLRPTSGVHEIIELPTLQSLPDASNVVLRERVVAPSTSRHSNTFNFPDISDTQNVVVTETVMQPVSTERLRQPISNVQGGLSYRPDMGSSQNIYVTEKTVRSGPATTTHLLSTEPLLMQSVGSTSPSLTRSSVRTYSTVQYTKN